MPVQQGYLLHSISAVGDALLVGRVAA
jgi:hypothetical protein